MVFVVTGINSNILGTHALSVDKKFALTTLHFMFLKLERWTVSLEVTTTKRRALAKELVYSSDVRYTIFIEIS